LQLKTNAAQNPESWLTTSPQQDRAGSRLVGSANFWTEET
jgi:hypothetical protein